MSALSLPRLFGASTASADFKSLPEDFVVEEVLGFEPSGEGEHCFLWIEKRDWNSNDVAGHLAERAGIRKRLVSHCGMKDRQAVTRQWFSMHLPGQPSPDGATLETEGIRVLRVSRNNRKLRRGSHDGNRFQICLRNISGDREEISRRWEKIASCGVPNYFGPQRFGRKGKNLEQARQFLSGTIEIRDRLLRGILISAARSYLFNQFVAARIKNETWASVLEGEVFGFANNRSLILPEKVRGDETSRFESGDLELTAPLWGAGELQSCRDVREFELHMAGQFPEFTEGLSKLGLKQERRVIRLIPTNPSIDWEDDETIRLEFELPKGTYATTVLQELFELNEPTGLDR